MNNKELVRQLYDKMNSININLQSVNNNINNLREELSDNFVIDGTVVESSRIEYEKDNISDVKDSVSLTVLGCLRSNF